MDGAVNSDRLDRVGRAAWIVLAARRQRRADDLLIEAYRKDERFTHLSHLFATLGGARRLNSTPSISALLGSEQRGALEQLGDGF